MNKLADILIKRLEFNKSRFNKKTAKVVSTFTDTIEDINELNESIDKEVEVADNALNEISGHKQGLISLKEQNLRIKDKIEKIIS